jgi:hypothetical protein
MKNEVLFLKLVDIHNKYPELKIVLDTDNLDFVNIRGENQWKESLRVYQHKGLVRSNSPKQRHIVSKNENIEKLSKT